MTFNIEDATYISGSPSDNIHILYENEHYFVPRKVIVDQSDIRNEVQGLMIDLEVEEWWAEKAGIV